MATDRGWMMVFGQAPGQHAGYVEHRSGRYDFRPVEI